MKITYDTSIFERVTKESFAKYFGIPISDIHQNNEPSRKFHFIQYENGEINLNYKDELIFRTVNDSHKRDNVFINYENFISGYDSDDDITILNYFELPYDENNENGWYTFRKYGQIKKLLLPLIKFVLRYKTMNVSRILFDKLQESEKTIALLTGGICMTHHNIPSELIVDTSLNL